MMRAKLSKPQSSNHQWQPPPPRALPKPWRASTPPSSRPKPEQQVLPCPYLVLLFLLDASPIRRSPNPIRGSRLNGSIHPFVPSLADFIVWLWREMGGPSNQPTDDFAIAMATDCEPGILIGVMQRWRQLRRVELPSGCAPLLLRQRS
jgi:hypothetical protein